MVELTEVWWTATSESIETAKILGSGEDVTMTKSELDFKPTKKVNGSKLYLPVYGSDGPIFEPITMKGQSVRAILTTLHRELNRPIDVKSANTSEIYRRIGGYFSSETRLKLVGRFEAGELTPVELMGDHVFIEGINLGHGKIEFPTGS